MIVAIHQPNYIPWLGFFHKIAQADTFVFLDTVQFTRGSFQNRNRVKTPSGATWLTQPVLTTNRFGQLTRDVQFADADWRRKHLNALRLNYRRAKGFDLYFERLETAYLQGEGSSLAEFNIELVRQISSWLGLSVPFKRASELEVEGESTALLVTICRAAGADTYLSGAGGDKYQDASAFEAAGVKLAYTDFQHPTYPQLWGEFVPNLSIIDLLLNCGDSSLAVLEGDGRRA